MTTATGVPETIIDPSTTDWIELGPGEWFKPLGFGPGGWRRLLLRLAPGTVVPLHRHRGEVHAQHLSGSRHIAGNETIIGPGCYVYEPAGNIDTWSVVGDEDCVVSITVAGDMEYLHADGTVSRVDNTATLRATYHRWCLDHGRSPDLRLDIRGPRQ